MVQILCPKFSTYQAMFDLVYFKRSEYILLNSKNIMLQLDYHISVL